MQKRNLTDKTVTDSYNKLVDKQQNLTDKMSNLGREKDYKVQKIEKEYNSKIDQITRELQAVALQIDAVKIYISKIGDSSNPAVTQIKTTKKEGR